MGSAVVQHRGTPAYSVLFQARLVAYVWEGAGELRRSQHVIAKVAFAHIETFAPEHEALLARLAALAPDLDALLFKLGVEGFDVQPGAARPHAHMKRF